MSPSPSESAAPERAERLGTISLLSRASTRPGALASSLPVPLTPLLGRESELALALDFLGRSDIRLLTLTGPSGIGKSRLAIEICREAAATLAKRVHIVSLATIPRAELVATAILSSLGIQQVGNLPAQDLLTRVLRDVDALLVFDNFEHLLDASPLLTDLLAACPSLKIVATSQAPLRLAGEQLLPVSPLSPYVSDPPCTADEAASSPAVQLFAHHASAVSPLFAITDDNAEVVAAICQRLDGLPLAIELAAAQIAVLPPEALLARIESRLPLPIAGRRDAPARHRTLRDAVAWSYDLLTEAEQRLFRRAGVFTGGFSLEAATAVCEVPEVIASSALEEALDAESETLLLLSSLVEKNLVRQEAWHGEPRFSLLETVRAFAREQLEAADELTAIADAHAGWYLDFAVQRERVSITPGGEDQLARLELEHANLRAALEWFANREDTESLLRLVAALGEFWYAQSHFLEARYWHERALAVPTGPSTTRGRVLAELGKLHLVQGDLARSDALLAEGRAMVDDDPVAMALILIWQGVTASLREEHREGERLLEQACEQAARIHDPLLAKSIEGIALDNLGFTAHQQGKLAVARERIEEALRIFRRSGYRLGAVRALRDLGDLTRDEGLYADSIASYRECLGLLQEPGDLRVVGDVLEGTAVAAAAWQQEQTASRLLGAAEALREQLGTALSVPSDRAAHERAVAAIQSFADSTDIDQAWQEGRHLSVAAAIAMVQEIEPGPSVAGELTPATAMTLSRRERDVLGLLVEGSTNREIAGALFISERTAENHVARLRAKLGVRTRAGAVSVAMASGLVEPTRRSRDDAEGSST